ncbi:MAG: hypothetical protein ABSC23_03995 [Bryobacteraceae bacterium]
MKRFLLLFCCCGALLAAADLSGVHAVYLMPMSHALDQFLASRLTSGHVVQVVVDPKLADAIFSDRIGEALTAKLDGISAAQQPPVAEDKDAKDAGDGKNDQSPGNKLDNPALSSTLGRAKGTLFLVDAKSRQVVWSTFEVPKSSEAAQLDRAATDIVSRLKRDLGAK